MRRSLVSLLPLTACVLAACTADDAVTPDESILGKTSSPIVSGQLDTTHQAVVALAAQQGLCSGTIIKTDPAKRIGWVLTAAHCTEVSLQVALQGNDFNANPIQYAVLDYEKDSRYQIGGSADQSYDVAVVRILGVDASTPTIAVASSSDGVVSQATFTAIGYGRTLGGTGSTGDADGKRRRISLKVDEASTTQFSYSMTNGGTCQGDSGGPDLLSSGGVEKVIGVHSYVEGDCNYAGVSGRVSGNLTFINAQLAKAVPALTCEQCQTASFSGKQKCAQLESACRADKDCAGLETCLSQAGSSSKAQQACLDKYPTSIGKILAAQSCGCTGDCATACADDANCKDLPQCGFALPEGSCATCGESSCCQEMSDCVADGTCFNCLQTSDEADDCASNAARKKIATCFQKHCSDECADTGIEKDPPDDGKDPTGDDDDGDDDDASDDDDAAEDDSEPAASKSGCSLSPASNTGHGGASLLALAVAVAAVATRRRAR